MRITVERLRGGIIVIAVVLVAAIGIFLAFARYERKRLIRDLPAKLGVEIQESADSFTLSKSDKGHTIFTLHASKAIQYKSGGHATLHDVSISLYGKDGKRSDRIHGTEFDYDQKSGIATAAGEVEIDLQTPAGPPRPAAPGSSPPSIPPGAGAPDGVGDPGKGTIHVKTSGLVFDRNTGTATTSNLVEFRMPQGAGHATGASYDSQAGVLVLDKAVELDSSSNGNPLSVHASHAQFLRDTRQAFLLDAVTDYRAERTASDEAIVYFRDDGSAEHVDAKGHVHITSDSGADLKAQNAQIFFDPHSQPVHADLTGGMFFTANEGVHHMHGTGVEGKVQLGEGAALKHVQLLNAVSFVDQQVELPDDRDGSTTREVRADQIDVDFASEPGAVGQAAKQTVPHLILASGGASAVLHTISAKHPQQNTTIAADQLLATLANGNAITSLLGTGHTRIVDTAADGSTQTSTGDRLTLGFSPAGSRSAAQKTGSESAGSKGPVTLPASQIQSALQEGNVTMTQKAAFGASQQAAQAASQVKITAQRAEYHAAEQVLHLTGSPRFTDGSLDLTSNVIDYERTTGRATATGAVKATYLEQPGPSGAGTGGATATAAGHGALVLGGKGPAHIVSDTAVLDRAGDSDSDAGPAAKAARAAKGAQAAKLQSGDAIFRGHARLWQGTNSISAPVIELSPAKQSLKAHGDASSDRVNATLASPASAHHPASVDHIESRELAYSAGEREADFSGSVVAQGAGGTIHSDQAAVFLVPAPSTAGGSSTPGGSSANPAPSSEKHPAGGQSQPGQSQPGQSQIGQSQIDRIVAAGHIVLEQPGRKATGDKLIYTAQDGSFTLTGTPAAPPRLVDQAHGAVTGASLIFNSRDDSVIVNGARSGARAATDTRVGR